MKGQEESQEEEPQEEEPKKISLFAFLKKKPAENVDPNAPVKKSVNPWAALLAKKEETLGAQSTT
jgi:hypothetical protein